MRNVICAIAKLENDYIYEWANYHLGIGFTHIYIYDNNEIDGERILDVFSESSISDSITVIDIRGQRCKQLEAYNKCYQSFDFDWCAFIDIDEFITFSPDSGITSIEQLILRHADHNAIVLNWLCYGDCDNVYYDNRPVLKRFPKPILPFDFVASQIDGTPENHHIKTIVKKGLDIDWEEDHFPFCNPHIPSRLSDIVNASSKVVENRPWQVFDNSVAYIRHYITKSLEEYAKKANRGAADTGSRVRYKISRYFRYNRITISKLRLVHRITGSYSLLQIINERFKWLSVSNEWPTAFLYRSFRQSHSNHG